MEENKKLIEKLTKTTFYDHYDLIEEKRKNLIAQIDEIIVDSDFEEKHTKYFIRLKNIIDVKNGKLILKFATIPVNIRTIRHGFEEGQLVRFNGMTLTNVRKENDDKSGSFGKWADELVFLRKVKYLKLTTKIDLINILSSKNDNKQK
jgi:hypothetical protein